MDGDRARTADESTIAYAYRPSLFGAAWEFALTDTGIDWVAGSRSGRVPFRNVRAVRMSYKPASMQPHRFVTELWADGAPKLQIVSISWKSMVEQERLDRPYSAFIGELHRRIALAAPQARFEQGTNPLKYWPSLILFVDRVPCDGGPDCARVVGRRLARDRYRRGLSRAVSVAGR